MTDSDKTPADLKTKASSTGGLVGSSPTPWMTVDLVDSTLVKTLDSVKNSITPIISVTKTILEIVKTLLDTVLKLVTDLTDLPAAAIKASIAVVRSLIEDLLNIGSFHGILIPVGKTDLELTELLLEDIIPGRMIIDAIESGGDQFPQIPPISPEDLDGTGGNYGFLRQVMESMHDPNDPNRPQFDAMSHIVAGVMVFGAATPYELFELIDKLSRALKVPGANAFYTPSPAPRGLRASVTPSTYGTTMVALGIEDANAHGEPDSDHPYAVKLEWDHESKTVEVDEYDNVVQLNKVHIYRATGPERIDPAKPISTYDKYKLAVMDFSEFVNTFYDNTIEEGNIYTYGVGFEIILRDREGNDVHTVSDPRNVVTATINTNNVKLPAVQGVPPDWFKANLLDMLFPDARKFVEEYVITFLDALEERTEDASKQIKKYVDFLEEEIQRYADWADGIITLVEEIIDVLTWPNVYTAATMIYSPFSSGEGGGGNAYFLSQLAQALNNMEDPNRPPFDRGTEAVCGMIIMAGSRSYGEVSAYKTFLETFLGSAEAQLNSTMKQGMDSINYLNDRIAREICVSPTLEQIVCPGEPEPLPAFDHDLTPRSESSECSES